MQPKTGVLGKVDQAERSGGNSPTARPEKGHPEEREHSDAQGDTRDRVPPASRSLFLARRIVTRMGRDPASRLFRDLRGSVTPAKAGGVEPDRRSRTWKRRAGSAYFAGSLDEI